MAENKKSFILYADLIHTVKKMPIKKAGELFLTILSYVNDENPVVDDIVIDLVFEPIKHQLKRDLKRFEEIVTKRKEAGKKGGVQSGEVRKTKQNEANASQSKQNEHDTDTDTDNVNDNDTVIKEGGASLALSSDKIVYSEAFKNFQEWIKKNAPRVASMKEPFTQEQYLSLKERGYDVTKIRELLTDMHNWADLHKKRVSAYLTLLNWKRREEK